MRVHLGAETRPVSFDSKLLAEGGMSKDLLQIFLGYEKPEGYQNRAR